MLATALSTRPRPRHLPPPPAPPREAPSNVAAEAQLLAALADAPTVTRAFLLPEEEEEEGEEQQHERASGGGAATLVVEWAQRDLPANRPRRFLRSHALVRDGAARRALLSGGLQATALAGDVVLSSPSRESISQLCFFFHFLFSFFEEQKLTRKKLPSFCIYSFIYTRYKKKKKNSLRQAPARRPLHPSPPNSGQRRRRRRQQAPPALRLHRGLGRRALPARPLRAGDAPRARVRRGLVRGRRRVVVAGRGAGGVRGGAPGEGDDAGVGARGLFLLWFRRRRRRGRGRRRRRRRRRRRGPRAAAAAAAAGLEVAPGEQQARPPSPEALARPRRQGRGLGRAADRQGEARRVRP